MVIGDVIKETIAMAVSETGPLVVQSAGTLSDQQVRRPLELEDTTRCLPMHGYGRTSLYRSSVLVSGYDETGFLRDFAPRFTR